MTYWMCESCGSCFDEVLNECPHCQEKCSFRDVTCYTPDCGGEGNIDPRLVSNLRSNRKVLISTGNKD